MNPISNTSAHERTIMPTCTSNNLFLPINSLTLSTSYGLNALAKQRQVPSSRSSDRHETPQWWKRIEDGWCRCRWNWLELGSRNAIQPWQDGRRQYSRSSNRWLLQQRCYRLSYQYPASHDQPESLYFHLCDCFGEWTNKPSPLLAPFNICLDMY